MLTIKYALLCLAFGSLVSCIGVRPGSSGGFAGGGSSQPPDESSAYATLYVSPGKLQRYIKPVHYNGPSKEKLEVDVTYRDTAGIPTRAELRGTLKSQMTTAPDTLAFKVPTTNILAKYPISRILYQERHGAYTLSRIEVVLDPARLADVLHTPAPQIELHRKGVGYTTYQPTAKTQKRVAQAARLLTVPNAGQ